MLGHRISCAHGDHAHADNVYGVQKSAGGATMHAPPAPVAASAGVLSSAPLPDVAAAVIRAFGSLTCLVRMR
jgi:hypothetical protein